MLVACQLVNRTQWETAEDVFWRIRARYPDPGRLARADLRTLGPMVARLGLRRRRSRNLRAMALAVAASPVALKRWSREQVAGLPGCGKYASDSWSIFVERRLDVRPDDGKLNWYMERMRG
ncbi:MAG: hypothetical protein EPN91_06340 [Salinibacterium sp.]|nr:MAG: hypothetical protein EPN91_06340 [Salinibacterium sp.]